MIDFIREVISIATENSRALLDEPEQPPAGRDEPNMPLGDVPYRGAMALGKLRRRESRLPSWATTQTNEMLQGHRGGYECCKRNGTEDD